MDRDKTREERLADLDAAWQQARERVERGWSPDYHTDLLLEIVQGIARGDLRPEHVRLQYQRFNDGYRDDRRNMKHRARKKTGRGWVPPPLSSEQLAERNATAEPLLERRIARVCELVPSGLLEGVPLRALLTWVDRLELYVRTQNWLRSMNIQYVWQLVEKSRDDLLAMPNCGRGTANEILETIGDLMGDQRQRCAEGWGTPLDPQLRQALEIACAEHP